MGRLLIEPPMLTLDSSVYVTPVSPACISLEPPQPAELQRLKPQIALIPSSDGWSDQAAALRTASSSARPLPLLLG